MNAHIKSFALASATALAFGISGCAMLKGDPGNAPATPRTVGQTANDAGITAKVKAAFAADELVKAHRINVDTVNGVVSLTGNVNSAAEKARAIQLAQRVDGVSQVKDNLKAGS